MKSTQIVLGLGFGDEGKGITTDLLCSNNPNAIVVRFSGGQQAAHTVKIGERKHIHSSFCSGALRGHPSYIAEHCTFHPGFFEVEKESLEKKGGNTEIFIHPLAKISTPFDVWHNRNNRQNLKDGSCGKGIGATMKRNESGFKLYAIDLLLHPNAFKEKLKAIGNYYGLLHEDSLKEELTFFVEVVAKNKWQIVDYSMLVNEPLIFEGSQGILLDMDHGFFPHVTYAHTTSKNAISICERIGREDLETFYVSRCYQTRHGAGWMNNEQELELINNEEETCLENAYQGKLRFAEFDAHLASYALNVDKIYNPKSQETLVITCLDQRTFNWEENAFVQQFKKVIGSFSACSSDMRVLKDESGFL